MFSLPKAKIGLQDIPVKKIGKYENCYVGLELETKRSLFQTAINSSEGKTLSSLTNHIQEKIHVLSDARNRTPIRLSVLKKLTDFLARKGCTKFSFSNLESKVIYIKGMGHSVPILKPKFPFNFATSEGMRIISHLFHDGGIGKNREPHYHNQDLNLIKDFEHCIEGVFGDVKIKIQKKTLKTRKYSIELPRLIGDVLETTGCFLGTKVESSVSPPDYIKQFSQELISEFVKAAMDDEGSVGSRSIVLNLATDVTNNLPNRIVKQLLKSDPTKRLVILRTFLSKNGRVKEPCVPKILVFDTILIQHLGIDVSDPSLSACYTNNSNSQLRTVWTISITGRKNIETFYKKIGFSSKHKVLTIRHYLENTRQVAPRGKKIENFLDFAKQVQKEKGHFTDFDITKKFGYHHQYLGHIRRVCENAGLVKKIGREGHKIIYVLRDR